MSRNLHPRRFVPRLESLEGRITPVCTILQQGDTLLITGSAQRDVVQVGDDGLGNVTVRCDQERTARLFTGVNRIQIRTLGGDDVVRYNLLNNCITARRLDVDLGAGADRFEGFLNDRDILGRARLELAVRGRLGNDVIRCDTTRDPDTEVVNALSVGLNTSAFGSFTYGAVGLNPLTLTGNPGTDLAVGASLSYRFSGDAGADALTCNHAGTVQGILTAELLGGDVAGDLADVIRMGFSGLVQGNNLTAGVGVTQANTLPGFGPFANTPLLPGTVAIVANGHRGNDRIEVDVTPLVGSDGTVRARVLGEAGNDTLRLHINPPPPTALPNLLQTRALIVDGLVHGGVGADGCTTLGNVGRISCP